MSREIKFRAYDKRLKMWCYDGVGFTLFGEVLMIDGFSSHFIENPAYDAEGKYLTSLDRIYEDIEVMQFTGLKDKNGKEIYEGDIVFRNGHKNVIVFYDGAFFSISLQDAYHEKVSIDWLKAIHHRWFLANFQQGNEVIGNIYENPELLK